MYPDLVPRKFETDHGDNVVRQLRKPPARACVITRPKQRGSPRSLSNRRPTITKAYYPGSLRITMRFTRGPGQRQAAGCPAVRAQARQIAKRVDIAAAAIFHGMTADAISDLDLSYTPRLGSP